MRGPAEVLAGGGEAREVQPGRVRAGAAEQQRDRGVRHDAEGGEVASVAGGRGDARVLDELPEQLRSSDPRGVPNHQHLLAVHDAQEMRGPDIITSYKRTCPPPYSSPHAAPNGKPRALPARPPRQGHQRHAQVGLGTPRHPPVQGRVHESSGTFFPTQLTNAEEVVNGESRGELGEILIRCNNILYIRESS